MKYSATRADGTQQKSGVSSCVRNMSQEQVEIRPACAGPSAIPMPPRGPKKIRIALADDHTIFRDGVRRLLALEPDFKVVAEARNGMEALEVLQQHRPDILLLDLRMPDLDGLAILQQIQGQGLKTRIIVLTASEDERDYAYAIQLGASGFVLKQNTTDVLIEAIRKVHQGEFWKSETPKAPGRQGLLQELPLTPREQEIAALVAQGLMNKEIAARLFISDQTVKNHLHNIFEKLGVSDRLELALYFIHKSGKSSQ